MTVTQTLSAGSLDDYNNEKKLWKWAKHLINKFADDQRTQSVRDVLREFQKAVQPVPELPRILDATTKHGIADNITIEGRSKSDVVQDVWDELVQRGMVRDPKREMVTQKPLAEQGCVHCNPIKRNKLLGDPRESVTVKFKP